MPPRGLNGPRHWLASLPRIPSHAVQFVKATARGRRTTTRTATSAVDAQEWLGRDACVDLDAIFGRTDERSNERDRPDASKAS